MQILLGAHETVIRIHSKSIRIDYIQDFINTHFADRTINGRSVFIPKSDKNSYHRTFLLKWLYSLHLKRTKIEIPKLLESLIQRQDKAIKILLSEDIVHRISWTTIDSQRVNFKIEPANQKIALTLKTYLNTKLEISSTHFSVTLKNRAEKQLLKQLLNSKSLIDVAHLHIYNSKKMDDFLEYKEESQSIKESRVCPINSAHMILGSLHSDDAWTLKKRYKKLAMKYHPDRVDIKDDKTVMLYTQKFQNILQAYEILLERVS